MNIDLYRKLLDRIVGKLEKDAETDFSGESRGATYRLSGARQAAKACRETGDPDGMFRLIVKSKTETDVEASNLVKRGGSCLDVICAEECERFVNHCAGCMSAFLAANGMRPITPVINSDCAIEMVAAMQSICSDNEAKTSKQ